MYFQLFEGNFILNKNLTKVLNFILSISTTTWSSKPKVPILWLVSGAALVDGRHLL
jgi:hypothetical protein